MLVVMKGENCGNFLGNCMPKVLEILLEWSCLFGENLFKKNFENLIHKP